VVEDILNRNKRNSWDGTGGYNHRNHKTILYIQEDKPEYMKDNKPFLVRALRLQARGADIIT
jgi:hypothetical protein